MSDVAQQALDELLADAKLTAAYGQRAGKLRSTDIFQAIAALEALPARSWSSGEAVALQKALNQAVADIAPTTLLDLREKNPFDPENKQSVLRRFALILVSILLMGVAAFFTVLYDRGAELIARLENVDKSKPSEKLAAVAREWRQANFEAGDKPADASETYYKMLDELQALDREVKAALADYYKLAGFMPLLDAKLGAPPPAANAPLAGPPEAPAAPVAMEHDGPLTTSATSQPKDAPSPGPVPGAAATAEPLAGTGANHTPSSAPPGMIPADPHGLPQAVDCANVKKPVPDADTTFAEFMKNPPGKTLGENKQLIENFACAESLVMISPYIMPYFASLENEIRKTLNIYGLWILPGLYGALGAMIFYMRTVLNPVLPDPPIDKIIHRVALGGFAGIIFAWFWAPTPDTMEKFVGLTVNSFAIAFVIGFSIDVFFALLDKLVTFLQGVINEPKASPPAKPG